MTDPLSSLPNELLSRILEHLSPKDINNLCSIPEFQSRLRNLVWLLSDVEDDKIRHQNVPNRIQFGSQFDHSYSFLKDHAALVIMEAHNAFTEEEGGKWTVIDRHREQIRKVTRSSTIPCHVCIYNTVQQNVYYPRSTTWLSNSGDDTFEPFLKGAKSVEYVDNNQCVDGSSQSGTRLVSGNALSPHLLFWEIFLKEDEIRPLPPSISHSREVRLYLALEGEAEPYPGFAVRAELLKWLENLNPEWLELGRQLTLKGWNGVKLGRQLTLKGWNGVKLPNLENLFVDLPLSLYRISNGYYPELRTLTVLGYRSIREIENLNLPKLETMHISTNSSLSLNNISAPVLEDLYIHSTRLFCEDVDTPKLEYATLDIEKDFPAFGTSSDKLQETLGWLGSTRVLSMRNPYDILYLTPHLKDLTITGTDRLDILEMGPHCITFDLPKLQTLKMPINLKGSHPAEKLHWPFQSSTQLRDVEIGVKDFTYARPREDYPNDPDEPIEEYGTFIVPDCFSKCHPRLNSLLVSASSITLQNFRTFHIRIEALGIRLPELRTLSVSGLSEDSLDLTDCYFPKLDIDSSDVCLE